VSWALNDLMTDADLVAYEANILSQFGQADWESRRTKACEDWLFPILKAHGFDPYKLRTRFEPDAVLGYTASAYTDKTSASQDTTTEDLNLATVFATVGTDALYIGSTTLFRGIFLRLLDSVSSATATLTVKYWNGAWSALANLADGTMQTNGKTLSAGGSVTWTLPTDWVTRKVNTSDPLYWVKVTVSATPTGAVASQIGTIRASALRAPVTFRTLQLIFQEAPTGSDGPWDRKAERYQAEAEAALQRALPVIGGEFDTDESDLVSETEAEQTDDAVGGGPFILERA
jgi:hypothetical protein